MRRSIELDLDRPDITESSLRLQDPRPAVFSVRAKTIHPGGPYKQRLRARLRAARAEQREGE